MGRLTVYTALPDQAYDPRVTDLDNPVRPPKATDFKFDTAGNPIPGSQDTFRNRNRSNTTPIQLTLNQSTRVLPANPRRTGLFIQNKDPVTTLNFSFGNDASALSPGIAPGGSALFYFTTPGDELYLFATASIQAAIIEISRGV
jgi:hypothetical protein